MLHLLLRKPKHKRFLELIGYSTGAHLIVLFLLFFAYKGDSLHFCVSGKVLPRDIPVVFMPLYKSLSQRVGNIPGGGMMRATKTVAPIAPATHVSAARGVTLVPEKKQIKKVLKKAATKHASKTAIKKREEIKKSVVAHAEPKKIVEKKPEPAIVAKQEVQQEPKIPEIVPVEHAAAHGANEANQSRSGQDSTVPAVQGQLAQSCIPEIPGDGYEVLYVGQQELQALEMQEYMQEELSKHWKPPVGFAPNTMCDIRVIIDWYGHVADVIIAKSSGILAYDSSARQAARAFEPPQWARGKELMITFKV